MSLLRLTCSSNRAEELLIGVVHSSVERRGHHGATLHDAQEHGLTARSKRVVTSLEKVVEGIGPLDAGAMQAARARQDQLTKPRGSLGRLEELSIRIAGIRGEALPNVDQKAIIIMAGDHGVVAEGVTAWTQEVTAQMVRNFLRGGAAVNVLARNVGARVVVVDMGIAADLTKSHSQLVSKRIGSGTRNILEGAAMSRQEALRAIEAGMQVLEGEIAKGLDIVGTGDMGIGNTTPSSAICAVITGAPVREVTGTGAGLSNAQVLHKVEVIDRAICTTRPNSRDPLDVLAKLGGFEIAGLVGAMLGAACYRLPIVLDGFISGAAGLIATELAPALCDYLIASHLSAEIGHRTMLRHMGLEPLLDLGLRLGEGTGAALGIFLAEAATRTLAEMSSFAQAGVSEAEE